MQPRFTASFGHTCWSIDTCQSKISAVQYHMTTSWAQVYSSSRLRVFFEVDQVLVFGLDCGEQDVEVMSKQ